MSTSQLATTSSRWVLAALHAALRPVFAQVSGRRDVLLTWCALRQLFGQNRGEEYLPSTLPERNGTLYWSVARNDSAVIIKVRSRNP